MALSKKTSITIAAIIVVLGVAVYYLWIRQPEVPNITVSGGPAGIAQSTFLTLAAQLEPIAFDTSILSDPRFVELVDIKTVIVDEASGRADPFATLPGVAAE